MESKAVNRFTVIWVYPNLSHVMGWFVTMNGLGLSGLCVTGVNIKFICFNSDLNQPNSEPAGKINSLKCILCIYWERLEPATFCLQQALTTMFTSTCLAHSHIFGHPHGILCCRWLLSFHPWLMIPRVLGPFEAFGSSKTPQELLTLVGWRFVVAFSKWTIWGEGRLSLWTLALCAWRKNL